MGCLCSVCKPRKQRCDTNELWALIFRPPTRRCDYQTSSFENDPPLPLPPRLCRRPIPVPSQRPDGSSTSCARSPTQPGPSGLQLSMPPQQLPTSTGSPTQLPAQPGTLTRSPQRASPYNSSGSRHSHRRARSSRRRLKMSPLRLASIEPTLGTIMEESTET